MNYIEKLGYIGQRENVMKLNNYVHAVRTGNSYMPPLAFFGPRGFGKTQLATAVGACLLGRNGSPKPFLEIQGSSVKSKRWFVDNIILPHINGQEVTLFIDEVHDLPASVKNYIMPIVYPNREGIVELSDDNQDFQFSYGDLSVIIATTDSHRLTQAFVTRCQRFDLAPYTYEELSEITRKRLTEVEITDEAMKEIVKAGRKTPRTIINLVRDIEIYCSNHDVSVLNCSQWPIFCSTFGIKPYGLLRPEVEYLNYLHASGPKTLTALASRLKLAPETVREDIESYLIDEDMIIIDGVRSITQKGISVLASISVQSTFAPKELGSSLAKPATQPIIESTDIPL